MHSNIASKNICQMHVKTDVSLFLYELNITWYIWNTANPYHALSYVDTVSVS